MNVPTIPIFIKEDYLIQDGLKVVSALRPDWFEDQAKNGVEILTRVFTEGNTNKLFGVRPASAPLKEMVMVKVYGNKTDLMIDRAAEIATFTLLYKNKCGAQLYGVFENGICYEFIPGDCLNMETCRDPNIYPIVAKEMARLHKNISLKPEAGEKYVVSAVWSKLQTFYKLNEDILKENQMLRKRLQNEYGYNTATVKMHIEELKIILENENMPITFCHNDLLLTNIIYNKEENYVKFIDFEYASPNYGPYDVANHFMEFCGIDKPDYSLLPKKEFRSEWIRQYLSVYGTNGFTQGQFEKWVELCIPLTDLYWAMWCVVQAHISTIEFDFAGYTGLRFAKFTQHMDEIRNNTYVPA